ncbi:hypothetical protein JIK52_31410 (plasmid) [Klebsiella variicola]|nr:hypothetical protein [Klebsiella variicola]QQM89222.1 hypothetical protein JIK52_31410 [Klebsiella variicola]
MFDTKLDDPLFAGINPEGCSVKRVRHLGYSTVLRIFTRASTVLAVEELGIPPFTAHSCRVGAAQDLAASGENALKIMMSGRWKSEVMVMKYCRSIFAEEGRWPSVVPTGASRTAWMYRKDNDNADDSRPKPTTQRHHNGCR